MKQVLNTKSATFLVIATFFLLYAFLYTRAVQKVQREGSLAEINLDHGKRATQHVLNKLTIDDYGGDEDEHGKEDYEDYEEEVKTEAKNEDDKDNAELSLQEMGMAKEENIIEHKIDSEKHQEEQSEKGEDVDKVNEGLKNRKRSNSRLRNGSKYAKNESSNLSGPNNVKHYAKKIARAKEAKALEDQKSLEKYLKSFDPSEVVENKSIFLFETNNDVEELAARTLCAMESAARTNIKRRIFLLIR